MKSRLAVVAAMSLSAVSSPLRAQGTPTKPAVISPVALKSMTSQKQRSKKPMLERAGMKRAPTSAGVSPSAKKTAPSSVRVLDPTKIR